MGIRSDFFHRMQVGYTKWKNLDDIAELKGTKIGIDGTGWLVEGGSSNANFFIDRCNKLRSIGIEPVFVFDTNIPIKKAAIRECLDAKSYIGPRYCNPQITNALASEKVEVILAPFESDSQLQYLMSTNYIYAVMSNDGDMIFRRIERVIYGWNLHPEQTAQGDCRYFQLSSLLKELEKENVSFELFQQACMLLGSDYHPPIQQKVTGATKYSTIKYRDALSLIKCHGSLRNLFSSVERASNFKCEPVQVQNIQTTTCPIAKKRRLDNAAYFTGDILPILKMATISAFCQIVQDPVLGINLRVDYSRGVLRGICENLDVSTQELAEAFVKKGNRLPVQSKVFDKIIDNQYNSCSQMEFCLKSLEKIRFMSQLDDFHVLMKSLDGILKLENGNKHFLEYNGPAILKEAMLICKDNDLLNIMTTVVACAKEEKNVREAFVGLGYYNFFLRMLSGASWCVEAFEIVGKFLKRDDKRFHQEPYLEVEGLRGCGFLLHLGACTNINAKTSDMNTVSSDIMKYFGDAQGAERGDYDEFGRGYVHKGV